MHLITFSLMGTSDRVRNEIKSALMSCTHARLLTESDDGDQLLADIARMRPNAAVIALERDTAEEQFDLIKKLTAVAPETAIVTASHDASPTTILGSIRAGAHEFLQLPIDNAEFQTVLERVYKRQPSEAGAKGQAHMIALFSAKGGAGVSFLATNLAGAMTTPTLLVDLNLQNGDGASFLGL